MDSSGHKSAEQQPSTEKGRWPGDKMPSSAYEALFDSGYSSTALSVHSSSNLFQSQSSVDFESDFHDKLSLKSPPATDSGLCIDSGLSLDSSSNFKSSAVSPYSSCSDPVRKSSSAIAERIAANVYDPFKQDDDGDT